MRRGRMRHRIGPSSDSYEILWFSNMTLVQSMQVHVNLDARVMDAPLLS